MIGIIGAGAWGSAIFEALSIKNKVFITSRKKRDMPNFISLNEIFKNEYIILVIAAQSIREFINKYKNELKDKKILVASKGIDNKKLKFLNEIFEG